MYQVDIVKKIHKWTCKLCGEKQSLKKVIFKGSGKDCRIQVQRLNESKGSCDHNHFTPNVSPCFSQSNGVTAKEALEAAKEATEIEWSDFYDQSNGSITEDALCEEGFYEKLTARTTIEERCDKEEKKTDQNHRQSIELSEGNEVPSTWDYTRAKRIHENVTSCSSELGIPLAKLGKMDINTSVQPDWNQFLPDELSD